ncbi:hypothetical protein GCM10025881_19630 [Pseudolysinimonas kribbensis]|uniref:PASTA domain-containing protein n=1 Tax=Pseudolysinimonas kribbensis TaxID=433641 RepID=A0ABQ6K6T2_9MICO|nr:hypothetical protein GCM10025881_19630 [Pseudolysinimonas kribbensis]
MAQINEAPPELPVTIAEPVRNLVYACIAKRPEDRPATAAHLARAAQALRRGDVAGAVAAVPGVAGHDPVSSFAADTSAATRLLPAGAAAGAVGAVATPGPTTQTIRRRNPWTWPLIAIVSVLAVALIAIIIVLLIRPTGQAAPTSSHTTQSRTPTPTPTPTATSHLINEEDYVGKPYDQVAAALGVLGYAVDRQDGPAATTPNDEGKVSGLNPTGNVEKGKTIKVYVYGPYPGAPAPSAATAPAGPQHGTITIAWTPYTSCPSGFPSPVTSSTEATRAATRSRPATPSTRRRRAWTSS